MSTEEQDLVSQVDIAMVSELLGEPMYLSELARKIQDMNLPRGYERGELENVEVIKNTWGDLSFNAALTGMAVAVTILSEDGPSDFEATEVGYDVGEGSNVGESQSIGSVHLSFDNGEIKESKEWKPYTIFHNPSMDESTVGTSLSREGYAPIAGEMKRRTDLDVTVEEKAEIARELSRVGNDVSRYAEEIMQDVMKRQFRRYEDVGISDYNNPGADFTVIDEDRRDYGLVIEVTTRWVNPVGDPYVNSKINSALDLEEKGVSDQPWDVVILAPKFRQSALDRYEDPSDPNWHASPDEGMVHLHQVPDDDPSVYHPFAMSNDAIDEEEVEGGGNPVIVPDSEKLRQRIQESGLVSDGYPTIEDDYIEFRDFLDRVFRDYVVVPESRYRSMLREAIEPLLWEFMRPYRIEQFLIDTYWDKDLTQSDIGELVDRSGSTIGRWMRDYGIMRWGTGAPELSDEVREIWRRMYEGEDPFPKQFSGYRIQAEYNRHPMWSLDDWREWYENTTEEERQATMRSQSSFRNEIDYTVMVGATDRLLPSYTFILSTLRDMGVGIRDPDEAPRVPYNAYTSRDALEWMINRDQNTIVDVTDNNE